LPTRPPSMRIRSPGLVVFNSVGRPLTLSGMSPTAETKTRHLPM
jgi:hypothetical protein